MEQFQDHGNPPNPPVKRCRCIVGLDPSARKDGFAICIIDEDKTVAFKTFKQYVNFIDWVLYSLPLNAVYSIENSNKQNKTFNAGKMSRLVLERRSRDVGKNQFASQLAYNLLVRDVGESNVFNISPKEKGAKWKDSHGTKVMLAAARSIGVRLNKKRFSQDEKDAFKMAYLGFIRIKRFL